MDALSVDALCARVGQACEAVDEVRLAYVFGSRLRGAARPDSDLEACVDLAYHVIADRGWVPADTARGAFLRLAEQQLIGTELAGRLALAVGSRNILVHGYAEVDLELLSDAARHGLDDLRQLGAAVGALLP
jgi:hypothetical protein